MEGTEPTIRERTKQQDGNPKADNALLMSSKPLHRFVRREPRTLGIVVLIFGCAEFLMGFQLATESKLTSCQIYIPFWQGFLFIICGNLSIYTEIHPSKKMVTVCLAMYVVSLLGAVVSFCYRIYCITYYMIMIRRAKYETEPYWTYNRMGQLLAVEGLLFTSSLCVSALLFFLCVIAHLALRSPRTQIIVQHISAPPQSDTAAN